MLGKATEERPNESRIMSTATIVLLIIMVVATGNLSRQSEYLNKTVSTGSVRSNFSQYNLLADSLLRGEVALDLDVSQDLANLSNPYSYEDRQKMIEDNPDAFYYFDTAFYNSKYYCYFGVVPALLFFLPFKEVTGCDLATTDLVIFLSCLFVLASYMFIRRFFIKNRTINKCLPLVLVAFVLSCNIMQLVYFPAFYSVPLVLGLDLTLLGLSLWKCSADSLDLNPIFMFFGSLSMAAVFGCRPQLGIGSLAAFYIFRDPLKEGRIFSKQNPGKVVAAVAPYLLVFIGLGLYNFERFGSFLDFGASYNLTGFDMTKYSQSWFLSISLILSYLFEPIKLSSSFPFVEGYSPLLGDLNSNNFAPNEPIPCGYFWLYPVILISILYALSKLKQRDRSLLIVMFVAALVVLVFDCRNAGISWRYFADFGWIFAITACWGISKIPCFNCFISLNRLKVFLGTLVALTLAITGFSLFSASVTRLIVSVNVARPYLYTVVSNFFS